MATFGVIDLYNLYYRAAKGVTGDAFTRAGMGLQTCFLGMRKLMMEMGCDHLVVCAEGHSWRYDHYPQYKASRRIERAKMTLQEREEDEIIRLTLTDFIKYLQNDTRVTLLLCDVAEGDDMIARFIKLHPNDEHILMSSDSDFIQLLDHNVTIYDAMLVRLITTEGVTDWKGREMVFEVKSDGKLKIKGVVSEVKAQHDKEQRAKAREDKSYEPVPFSWSIDDEWWKRALFTKCVRGDKGDGIFSAYPGVRYKGTKNSVGIQQAWDDRHTKGFEFNNFMNQTWKRPTDEVDEDGNAIIENVLVADEIAINTMLIDLTKQPEAVRNEMDLTIVEAIQKEPVADVGTKFLKFCNTNQLPKLAQQAQVMARILNRGYPRG